MTRVELISGVDRRRRWTPEEKQAHVVQAFMPGVNVRAYARQEDIAPSALYKWREALKVAANSSGGFMRIRALADQTADSSRTSRAEPVAFSAYEPGTTGEASIILDLHIGKASIPQSTPPSLAAVIIQALVRR